MEAAFDNLFCCVGEGISAYDKECHRNCQQDQILRRGRSRTPRSNVNGSFDINSANNFQSNIGGRENLNNSLDTLEPDSKADKIPNISCDASNIKTNEKKCPAMLKNVGKRRSVQKRTRKRTRRRVHRSRTIRDTTFHQRRSKSKKNENPQVCDNQKEFEDADPLVSNKTKSNTRISGTTNKPFIPTGASTIKTSSRWMNSEQETRNSEQETRSFIVYEAIDARDSSSTPFVSKGESRNRKKRRGIKYQKVMSTKASSISTTRSNSSIDTREEMQKDKIIVMKTIESCESRRKIYDNSISASKLLKNLLSIARKFRSSRNRRLHKKKFRYPE